MILLLNICVQRQSCRLVNVKIRPTSACSRLATSRFFNYILPAKALVKVICRADPQAADAETLGGTVSPNYLVFGFDFFDITERWVHVENISPLERAVCSKGDKVFPLVKTA